MKKTAKLLSFISFLLLMVISLVACNSKPVGIKNAEINNKNELVFELTDGNKINVGVVVGDDGQTGLTGPAGIAGTNGISVVKVEINELGILIVTLSNNQQLEAGMIKGEDGKDGKDGRELELKVSTTHILWRYVGDEAWNSLIEIDKLKGAVGEAGSAGANGKVVLIQTTFTHIQWKYEGDTEWSNLVALNSLKGAVGDKGEDGISVVEVTVNNSGELILTLSDGSNINAGKVTGIDGKDGKEVEFNVSATHIQWRYVGDAAWVDLVSLATLTGSAGLPGVDGKEVEFNLSATHIQWRYVGEAVWVDLVDLALLTGAAGNDGINGTNGADGISVVGAVVDASGHLILTLSDASTIDAGLVVGVDGKDGKEVEFNVSATHIQWRYVGDAAWVDLVSLATLTGSAGLPGVDGKEVEFNLSATHIQWRYVGEAVWVDLVDLALLTGAAGNDGINGTNGADGISVVGAVVDASGHLILTLSDASTIDAGLVVGVDGIGILSIEKTNTVGLVDTYTITFTDGTTTTFTVTNGAAGAQGEQGIQGIQGEAGADGHSPVITIGENGNWFIDGVDTTKLALGVKGDTGNGISNIEKTSSEGLVDTYTITFTDGTTTTFTVTNGAAGAQGEQGIQGIQGEAGADGHSPVITIGENGNWFIDGVDTTKLALGVKGDTGNGISNIEKTSSEGLVDTYTITFTDGTTTIFTVTNGKDGIDGEQGIQGIQGEAGADGHSPVITIGENGNWFIDGVDTTKLALGIKGDTGNGISAIEKTDTVGLVDTYTITFTDGSTTTFTVTNGTAGAQGEQGIQGIQGEAGADGHSPVITIGENGNWYIDGVDTTKLALGIKGDTGNGISNIEKTSSEGLVDTYTITFTDGTTTTFTVTNGAAGAQGEQGIQGIQGEAGADGHSPVITIGENGNWFIDGVDTTKLALGVKGDTGNGISNIEKTSSEGLVDTYTITFTDGTTTTFTVTNGKDGIDGEQGIQGIQGEAGADGHSPVITIGENGNWFIDGVDTTKLALGVKGQDGREVEFNVSATHIQWRYVGEETWVDLVSLATLAGTNGVDGQEVEFNVSETHIQWRYVGADDYIDLIKLELLTGAAGKDGIDGTNGISVVSAAVNTEGKLILTLSDGSTIDAGKVLSLHVVTFYDDNGYVLKTQFVIDGQGAVAPSNPVKEGHTFNKWDVAFDEVTADLAVTALYNKKEYTVTFSGLVDTEIVEYGDTLTTLPEGVYVTGQRFVGWYLIDNTKLTTETVIVNNITVYPRYEQLKLAYIRTEADLINALSNPDVNTVFLVRNIVLTDDYAIDKQFNIFGNNYELDLASYTITFNQTDNYEHYIIEGLFKGGTIIVDNTNGHFELHGHPGTTTIIEVQNSYTESVHISGQWYSVAVTDTNGVTYLDAEFEAVTTEVGTRVVIQDNFKLPDEVTPSYGGDVFYGDITKYDVTFIDREDEWVVKVNSGNLVKAQSIPVKEGYSFVGWFEGEVKFDFTTPINKDITLNSKFEINQYKITYKVDGVVEGEVESYDFGAAIILRTNPTKEGHTFSGWNPASLPATMPANDIEVVGSFTINQYTITFDSDGGSEVASITKDYGAAVTKPSDPEKTGHSFVDWYSDAELKDVYTFTTMPAANITVYAKWAVNEYSVIYKVDGAEYKVESYDFGEEITILGALTKEGYTFSGWNPASLPATMPAEDLVVIGTFTLITELDVATEVELLAALADDNIRIINLVKDILLTNKLIVLRSNIVINGQEHKLSLASDANWQGDYILQFYLVEGIVINELTFEGGDAALLVNGSEVVVNNIVMLDQEFGGIEVSQGAGVTEVPKLVVTGTITYDSLSLPTIWIDGKTSNDGWVVVGDLGIHMPNKNQVWFTGASFEAYASLNEEQEITYHSIQAAINAANAGETILVSAGTHYEVVDITKPLTVKSVEGRDATIIDAGGAEFAVNYKAQSQGLVVFEGFTVQNWLRCGIGQAMADGGENSPFHVLNNRVYSPATSIQNGNAIQVSGNGSLVKGNIAEVGEYIAEGFQVAGILVVNASNVVVEENEVFGKDMGISVQGGRWPNEAATRPARDVIIRNNNIHDIELGVRIYDDSQRITITGNTFVNVLYAVGVGESGGASFEVLPPVHDLAETLANNTFPEGYEVLGDKILLVRRVSFETNGGTPIETIKVADGGKVGTPDEPTKVGHTFVGWFTTEAMTEAFDFGVEIDQDLTIYVKWSVNQYTITFDSDGGSEVASITKDYGAAVTKPSDPEKTGHSFVDWYSDAELKDVYTFTTMPAANITVYAKWAVNEYSVIYKVDGAEYKVESYDFGEEITILGALTKEGYTFSGWNPASLPETMPAEDLVVIGTFTLITELDVATEVELLAALADDNIRIINLVKDILLTNKLIVLRSNIVINGQEHKLSLASDANWQGDYILQFYLVEGIVINELTFEGGDAALLVNGSEVVVNNIVMLDQEFGGIEVSQGAGVTEVPKLVVTGTITYDSLSLPTIWIDGKTSNDGWVVVGDLGIHMPNKNQVWFTGASFEAYASLNEEQEITYHSIQAAINAANAGETILVSAGTHYEVVDITKPLTVKSVEGRDATIIDAGGAEFAVNYKAQSQGLVVFEGFTVQNWLRCGIGQAMADGGENSPFHVLNNRVYSPATSIQNGNAIQVSGNGSLVKGNIAEVGEYIAEGFQVAGILVVNASNVVVEENEVFGKDMGISVQGGRWPNETATRPARDIMIKNNNIHDIELGVRIYDDSQGITITGNTFVNVLYAVGVGESGGASFEVLPPVHDLAETLANNTFPEGYEVLGDKILLVRRVSFETNGGTPIETIKVADGGKVGTPDEPTKVGHTFVGWFTTEAMTEAFDFGVEIDQDLTIYVKWSVNQYTITFDSDGGSEVASITKDYGAAVTKPSDPEKTGHSFVDWYSDAELKDVYTFTTMPAANITVYAKWAVNEYSVIYKVDGAEYKVESYDFGEEITILGALTKEGYTFSGWNPASLPETMPAEDLVVIGTFTLITELDVATEVELLAALADDNIRIINLVKDILLTNKLIVLRSNIVINGQEHKLSLASDANWQGDYILQFYLVEGIVINELTFEGGDAALLVNGSEVVVNNIVMLDQEFGGIEVSQGAGVTEVPKLVVTGTITYDSLSLPTIWIDGKTSNDGWVVVGDLGIHMPNKNQVWFTGASFEAYASLNEEQEITYHSIQAAINAANAGETILVSAGTHYEVVDITKPLTVKSVEGRDATIIDAGGAEFAVNYKAQSQGLVVFEGFTVQNWLRCGIGQAMADGGENSPFHVLNNRVYSPATSIQNGNAIQVSGNGSLVKGNIAEVGEYIAEGFQVAGILVVNASNVVVEENEVFGKDMGISVQGGRWPNEAATRPARDIMIKNNNIHDIELGVRIYDDSQGITITGNTFVNVLYAVGVGESGGASFEVLPPVHDLAETLANNTFPAGFAVLGDAILLVRTVSFETNGGTPIEAIKVADGKKVGTPDEPTKVGHTFVGWFTTEAMTEAFDFGVAINEDLTIYVKWSVNQYKITYKVDGEVEGEVESYDFGEAITLRTNPTKEGHTFSGWNPASLPATMPANDIEVVGSFTINQYEVKFVDYDGAVLDTQTIDHGGNVTAPESPTRAGFKFVGWLLDESAYNFDSSITGNITLVASYEDAFAPVKEYIIIKYNENEYGMESSDDLPLITGHLGATITWLFDPGVIVDGKWGRLVRNDNVTLTAKITIDEIVQTQDVTVRLLDIVIGQTYTEDFETQKALTATYADGSFVGENGVTFTYGHSRNQDTYGINDKGILLRRASDSYIEFTLSNGLSALSFDYRKAFTGGDNIRQLEIIINGVVIDTTDKFGPTGEDATIHNYNSEPLTYSGEVTVKIKIPGTSEGNAQITIDNISWTEPTYTNPDKYYVEFDAKAGTGTYNKQLIVANGFATMPEVNPVPETGYQFVGWFLDDVEFSFETAITKDIMLVAEYELIKYQVTFDLAGGTLESLVSPIEVKHGMTVSNPGSPTHTSDFLGWYLSLSDESAYNFSTPVTSPITLIAKYDTPLYVVSFDLNGGSGEITSQTIAEGQKASQPIDPIPPTGKSFVEWRLAGVKYNFTEEVTTAITLVAYYETSKHTITYANTDLADETLLYGAELARPLSIPLKDNKVFLDWYVDEDFETPFTFPHTVTGDITIYARFLDDIESVLSKPVGTDVVFVGVVTGFTEYNATDGNYDRVWIEDETGAITLYNAALAADLAIGDKYKAEGKRTDYKGLKEIAEGGKYTYISSGNSIINPINISDITDLTTEYQAKRVNIVGIVKSISESGQEMVVTVGLSDITIRSISGTASINQYILTGSVGQKATLTGIHVDWYDGPRLIPTLESQIAFADLTELEKANIVKDMLEQPLEINNQDGLDVPTEGSYDATIVWSSDYEDIINPITGAVRLPMVETVVTLTATITVGTTSVNRIFEITVKAVGSEVETVVYETGFETSEGFAHNNNYTGFLQQKGWSFQYANTVNTGSPAYGSMQTLIRVAKNTTNIGYIQYNIDEEITKVTFQAKYTHSSVLGSVKFSVDGVTWGESIIVAGLKTSYSTESFEFASNVEGAKYIRIEATLDTADSENRDLFVDDIKIYAMVANYVIRFAGEGINEKDIFVTAGNKPTSLPTPIKEGYTFLGWNTKADGTGTNITTSTIINSNNIVYPKWEVAEYNVTFMVDGVAYGDIQTIEHGKDATAPATNPTKEGYTFTGWDKGFTNVTSNLEVNANFTANEYTITFVSNGGSTVASITQGYETPVTQPANPTKDDYDFAGWYSDSEFNNIYTFTTMPLNGITLYAKWLELGAKLQVQYYNLNGATNTNPDEVNSGHELVDPTREGFTFLGWYSDPELTIEAATTITTDSILYAKWEKPGVASTVTKNVTASYTGATTTNMTFGNNASIIGLDNTLFTVGSNQVGNNYIGLNKDGTMRLYQTGGGSVLTVSISADYKIIKFEFEFGSIMGNAEVSYDSSTDDLTGDDWKNKTKTYDNISINDFSIKNIHTSNVHIYIKSIKIWYTEEVAPVDANPVITVSNSTINLDLTETAETANLLLGVSAEDDVSGDITSKITVSHSINWGTAGTYPVTYKVKDAAGNEGTNTATVVIADLKTPIIEGADNPVLYEIGNDIPTLTDLMSGVSASNSYGSITIDSTIISGYDNIDWTTADTYEITYTVSYQGVTTAVKRDVIVSAQLITYRVTFNSNGGSQITSAEVAAGYTVAAPTPPTKAGHDFAGWFKDALFEVGWTFETDVVNDDITLYANWNPIEYIITFDGNGGTPASQEETAIHGGTVTAPETIPTRTGYEFVGWFDTTNATGGNEFKTTTTFT